MGLQDTNFGGFDADQSAYNRQNRVNPPEFAPGQGDNSMDDIFNNNVGTTQSTQGVGDMSGGNIFGNALSNQQGVGGFNAFGQPAQQQQQTKSDDERFWEMAGQAGKASKNFLMDYVQSFGKVTAFFWSDCGMRIAMTGGVVAIIGVILKLFGVKFGMQLAAGGCFACAVGVCLWLFLLEAGKECSSMYKEDNTKQDVPQEDDGMDVFGDSDPFGGSSDSFGDDSGFDEDSDFGDFGSDEGDEDDDWGDEDFDWGDESEEESQPIEGEDKDKAIESMPDIQKGMYTRQFLYEQFTKVLPCYKPDFYTMHEYDSDSEEFLFWGDKLQEAAMAIGMSEDNLPELQSLKENLFTIVFECDRPKGFKPEVIGQELASIYSYEMDKNNIVSYEVRPVGLSCFITLYTGESAAISLRDMYKQYEDFMLDSSKLIPVVVGVDTSGRTMGVDLKNVESILVTGKPRSGKTWFVQCLLYQMCAFNSPDDVNIYILDPKDDVSDYKRLYIPHIKRFEQSDKGVLDVLRYLINQEATRRRKIIGSADCVKIWDYREKYPEVKLPVIYVVIDEMATFASRMDKDTRNEFRDMLRILITQLPSIGIRAIMIPHALKDDIIQKTTSDLIMCRISVKGDAEDIERVTGAKPREFRHVLVNQGDMAVRIKEINPDAMFIHAPILTNSSHENEELFSYMKRVWAKLCPDSIKGSYAELNETNKEQEELLRRMQDTSILDDDDLF